MSSLIANVAKTSEVTDLGARILLPVLAVTKKMSALQVWE
jgi:hypothetical protein